MSMEDLLVIPTSNEDVLADYYIDEEIVSQLPPFEDIECQDERDWIWWMQL